MAFSLGTARRLHAGAALSLQQWTENASWTLTNHTLPQVLSKDGGDLPVTSRASQDAPFLAEYLWAWASLSFILINPVKQPQRKISCQVSTESLWHSRTWARLLCRLRKSKESEDYRETVYLSLQELVLHPEISDSAITMKSCYRESWPFITT